MDSQCEASDLGWTMLDRMDNLLSLAERRRFAGDQGPEGFDSLSLTGLLIRFLRGVT